MKLKVNKLNWRQRLGAAFTGRVTFASHSRAFFAGAKDTLIANWFRGDVSADAAIHADLQTLRARSRDLARNNDYGKRFINMAIQNVLGHQGIKLQAKAKLKNGKLDIKLNPKVEAAWKDSGKMRNSPTACGKMSRYDLAKLALRTLIADGECILLKMPGYRKNESRLAYKFIDADRLDHTLNADLGNGRQIRMGVEIDEDERPIAYHILERHPGEIYQLSGVATGRRHMRIDADRIEHIFLMERPHQTRGVPWLATPMERMKMLDGFEQAVVVGARVAAATLGFFKPNDELGFEGEGVDPDGFTIMNGDPGTWHELPKGLEIEKFDPAYPPANFEEFMKVILRGIAAGLNVSYFSLANDLEGVNYSSARIGLLDERDAWKILQVFMTEHFYEPMFSTWWESAAMLAGIIDAPEEKLLREPDIYWQPRGWAWVDPVNEVKANLEAINGKIKSRTKCLAEQGEDIEETFETLAQEEELGHTYNIDLSPPKTTQANNEPKQPDDSDEKED